MALLSPVSSHLIVILPSPRSDWSREAEAGWVMVVMAVVLTLLLLLLLSLYLYLLRRTGLEEREERDPVVQIISAPASLTTFSPPPQHSDQREQLAGVFTRKIWPARAREQPKVKILEISGPVMKS